MAIVAIGPLTRLRDDGIARRRVTSRTCRYGPGREELMRRGPIGVRDPQTAEPIEDEPSTVVREVRAPSVVVAVEHGVVTPVAGSTVDDLGRRGCR